MVMGNFQVTLTQSLRIPAEDLLPPGHQWLGVPPPVVTTNEVLLAITQQTQQLALQRAVPPVTALQGKQPSASQSEAFPRMSRVLSLFTPTEQLRYFSDLSVPVGERLTADRIAPARPAQLVLRLLLSQVYRPHEIPLKLSDDDLKHMMYLEFGQSSKQPISITMFTPRTLQTDPMISLGQAVNYASDFYSRLTQIPEWEALKSMYMTLSSYIAPNIFTVADITLLINNQLDDIPLYFMDVVTPVGVDPRQYIGHLLLGALTVDEDAVKHHIDRQVMALVSKGSLSAAGSGTVSGRNKRKHGANSSSSSGGGATSTSGAANAASSLKGQPTAWHDTPIKTSEFPASKTPCFYWLCGKGTCANNAICSQTVTRAHEFPANLEPKKDAYIDFIVNKLKYKFK
jgi:hypothetical protein